MPNDTHQKCAAQHFGAWAIKPDWMRDAVNAVRSGQWKPAPQAASDAPDGGDDERPYQVHGGVAVISITGHITKRPSSFSSASTVMTRRALHQAVDDRSVKAIMLVVDSPGGRTAGVADLADDVARVDREHKPVYAFASDLCCSAGYWIASQARRVYANRTAIVGCIGTYGVLVDTSKADQERGIEYVLVSTGGVKGLGADGKVSDELVADYLREVNELQAEFNASVMRGRGWDQDKMQSMADGRAYVGSNAMDLGLVDEISMLEVAIEAIKQETMMNREQFMAAASENPTWLTEAAAPLVEAAVKDKVAKSEADKAAEAKATGERERCVALAKSFGQHPEFLAARIADGSSEESAAAKAWKEGLGASRSPESSADREVDQAASSGVTGPVDTERESQGSDPDKADRESAREWGERQNKRESARRN